MNLKSQTVLLSLLLVLAPPVFGTQVNTINVMDFGAKADGIADDTSAINAAIVAGEKLGPGATVLLPSGRYRVATGAVKSIVIEGADHLTVVGGSDATIVSSDFANPIFRIRNSQNLTIGHLSIDRDPLDFTQGTIVSVNVAQMTCEVTIDDGYPDPDAPWLKNGGLHPIVFPKQGYYQLDRYWPQPGAMLKTGNHSWHWTLVGPPNIENWAGKRFFLAGNGQGHAFDINNLQDGTFKDINYWAGGANAGFYIHGLTGTTTFRHFLIGVPPGSNRLLSCAGGGQISDLRGKLMFDDCNFSKIDDDGVDILSTWTRIIGQKDARTLIVQSRDNDYWIGDRVEIWDWLHKKERSPAVVESVMSNADGSFTLGFDRNVVTERVGPGTGPAFGTSAVSDGIDRLIDIETVGQSTLVHNCTFQVYRAKCLNLKAANCTVEGCTFHDSFQPAISAAPEWYFEEGPTIRNLIVRNCKFIDCNHDNIDVGAASYTGVPGADPKSGETVDDTSHDSTNILIENNSFVDYGTVPSVFPWWRLGPAVHVTNADQVTIRGNTFGPLSALAPPGTDKIFIERCTNTSISGNHDVSGEVANALSASSGSHQL